MLITGDDTLLLLDEPDGGYVVKFNYAGNLQWALSTSQPIQSMVHRPNGSMRLFAPFTGTFTVGDSSVVSNGGTGLAVIDLAPDGSVQLLHGIPDLMDSPYTTISGIEQTADGSMDLVVCGTFTDSLHVADTLLIGPESCQFLARISWNGLLRWAVRIGSVHNDGGLVQDSAGQLIIAGITSPDFPADTLVPSGGVFVASFAPNGTLNWSHSFSDHPADYHPVVNVDAANNVLFAYSAYAGFDGHHVAVTKFDASGAVLWEAITTGADPDLDVSSIIGRSSGDIVVAGWGFGNPVQFGDQVIAPGGAPSSFFATLDGDGICTSVFEDNGDGNVFGPRMSDEMAGTIYAAGYFESVVNYGQFTGPLLAPVGTGIFITMFSSSPMGIHTEVDRGDQLLSYPNPVHKRLHVKFSAAMPLYGELALLNSTGQVVVRSGLESSSTEIDLDMSSHPSGLYLLQYTDQQGIRWESKIIKE